MHNFITSSVAKRTLRNLSHFYVAVRGEGPRAAEAKIQGRNVQTHSDFDPECVSKPWFRKSLASLHYTLSLKVKVLPVLNHKSNSTFCSGLTLSPAQAYLRETVGFNLDHHNKANIARKWVAQIFWFPNEHKVMFILQCSWSSAWQHVSKNIRHLS